VGQTAALVSQKLAGVALGVVVNQLESNAARSLGADVFRINTTDVPIELSASRAGAFLRGTEVEYGRYLSSSSYLSLQLRPLVFTDWSQNALGVRYQYRTMLGLRLETSFEPRYLLSEPTLAPRQNATSTSVLGVLLMREWRF
jgi:hypothetical protein